MDVQQAINFGLEKLGFKSIKENQRKVVEGYLSGRDVLMVAPTGSGKSLTFQISPFALDYWKHGDRNDVQTVCLVIAPLVSLMKDQISILRKKQIKAVMIGPESSAEENREASEGKYNLVFASPEAIFHSHRSTIVALKDKIEAVFIDEGHCVVKWGHGNGLEEAFRTDYSRLAELRSILKKNTPFIALTATATEAVRACIIKDLSMKGCVQLVTIPNKNNIRFSVSVVDSDDLTNSFQWLIDELKTKKLDTQKVLIFCRKKSHVKDLYEAFHEALGPQSYVLPTGQEPIDDRTRLFAMYHKKTHHLVKEVVEREFCKVNGTVRVVFCTIAFGIGVNVQGAYLALHLGPSSHLDDYIQECGRVGRTSERMSHAVLLKYSGCTRSKNITKTMKEYVKNTDKCRRSLLMKPFLTKEDKELCQDQNEQPTIDPHSCCDVCAKTCRCLCSCQDVCSCNVICNSQSFYSPIEMHAMANNPATSKPTTEDHTIGQLYDVVKDNPFQKEIASLVRDELLQYRAKLAYNIPDERLLTGIDIATGFSSTLLGNIVSNIGKIDSLKTLKQLFSFFNEEHAVQSWLIISSVKGGFPPVDMDSCPSGNVNSLLGESINPSSEHSSTDESDDSDVYSRHRICNVFDDSDSDDID